MQACSKTAARPETQMLAVRHPNRPESVCTSLHAKQTCDLSERTGTGYADNLPATPHGLELEFAMLHCMPSWWLCDSLCVTDS